MRCIDLKNMYSSTTWCSTALHSSWQVSAWAANLDLSLSPTVQHWTPQHLSKLDGAIQHCMKLFIKILKTILFFLIHSECQFPPMCCLIRSAGSSEQFSGLRSRWKHFHSMTVQMWERASGGERVEVQLWRRLTGWNSFQLGWINRSKHILNCFKII